MELKWNIKQITNFGNKLKDTHDFETAIMTATREVARVLHRELLNQTPIDTGNLRKMWSAGKNLLFTVDRVKGGYQVTFINEATNKRSVADSEIRNEGNGYMYGIAVNDGHRTKTGGWVMGRFFVEKSILITSESAKLNSIIYKELEKWFKRCVNGK